jgi:diguanylate cyclase (GGDEF)-like protein
MKENFFAKMGTKYGFTLYLNRPIALIMNNHPLIVDCETTIDTVSKMAMTRCAENLYDIIIVTDKNGYMGIVTVKDLLEKTTEIEINYAKHLNPLSGLPGNMLIENKLNELLSAGGPFTVMYLDIDNFKAYNDVYGFEKGDKMLQITAGIIEKSVCESVDSRDRFIGHIGGDDFVVCVKGFDVEGICQRIIGEFESKMEELYSPSDFKNGYICINNRRGDIEEVGNVTLSIACITNREKNLGDIYELSKIAAQAKRDCKNVSDNHYVIY